MALRVLVTGAGGQLGQVLVRDLKRTHEVFALTRSSLDLMDRANVPARVAKWKRTGHIQSWYAGIAQDLENRAGGGHANVAFVVRRPAGVQPGRAIQEL